MISELRELPAVERAEALELIVAGEMRGAMLMSEEDELPFDRSFFDLGLTSLVITDLKQRLEGLLGCEIDANVLFNSPTLERLLAHLTETLFAGPGPSHAGQPAAEQQLATDLDRMLYGAALAELNEQR